LPEVMQSLTDGIFTEIKGGIPSGTFTARKPVVSSLRRNLQREYVDRLIDLSMPGRLSGAAAKPVSTLAQSHPRQLTAWAVPSNGIDPYTRAHCEDLAKRIERALDAQYIANQPSSAPPPFGFFGRPTSDAGSMDQK